MSQTVADIIVAMVVDEPVLLLAFNRAAKTSQVLERLREVGVQRLYVALDGPRDGHPEDEAACAEVQALVDGQIWAPQVQVLRRTSNLGGRDGVISGLDWFFGAEQRGIVLEDDCLPSDSFFSFCSALLDRYADDRRVHMISGSNLLGTWRADASDYSFGEGHVWGWASWADRWREADMTMADWSSSARRRQAARTLGPIAWPTARRSYAAVAAGRIDAWDHQWSWSQTSRGRLAVVPARNLVSNIGFDAQATHTTQVGSRFAALSTGTLREPLRAPARMRVDRGYQLRFALRDLRSRRLNRIVVSAALRRRARFGRP